MSEKSERKVIDTSELYALTTSSRIELKRDDNGEWRVFHRYRSSKTDGYLTLKDGVRTTKVTLKYLRLCQEDIEVHRKRIDLIGKKLADIIEELVEESKE